MKRMKGLLMLGVTAVMMFALTGCGKTTVKLDKYVTITAEGYDSMGTASYDFDYDAFKKDYSGEIKTSKNSNELSGRGLLSGETSDELLLDFCVSQKLDKTSGLSNGDVVTLKWNCEDAMAEEYFNVKLDYSDVTYTVKGLEEVGKFNPFDYVTVTFSGTSPNGSVTITPNYDQSEVQYINFSANKSSGLKNGDSITITASIAGSTDSFVEKFGCILGESEKEYTCDSLAYYISDVNEIPEDMMNKMKTQGEDAFRSYVAQQWDRPENLISVSLAGNYYLTLKDGMNGNANNYLYLVYEILATNPDPEQTVDFYYYVCFNDLIMLADGTCSVDLSSYSVPSSGWGSSETFKVGRYKYIGYDNLDSLFNNCVVSKIENYQYTTTLK